MRLFQEEREPRFLEYNHINNHMREDYGAWGLAPEQ